MYRQLEHNRKAMTNIATGTGMPPSEFRNDDMLPNQKASKTFRSFSQSHMDDPYFLNEATKPLRINRKHSTLLILSPSSANTPFSPLNSSSLSTPVSITSNVDMQPPQIFSYSNSGSSGISNNNNGKPLPLNSPKSTTGDYKSNILFNSNNVSLPSTALDSVLRSKKQASSPERPNDDRTGHGRAVSIDNIRYLSKSNNSNGGSNNNLQKQGEAAANLSAANVSQHPGNNHVNINNSGNGIDFETRNIDMTNAYFKRLSMLPEIPAEHSPSANIEQVMTVSRKLLFVFSETYQAFKKFNVIYSNSNQTKLRGQILTALSQCKKQVNGLVLLLENSEANKGLKEFTGKYVDQVLSHLVATIITLKLFLQLMIKNIKEVTRSSDVCFIRLLILSMYGCHNEIYNAWVILNNQEGNVSKKGSNNSSMENVQKLGSTTNNVSSNSMVNKAGGSGEIHGVNNDNNDGNSSNLAIKNNSETEKITVKNNNDNTANGNEDEEDFEKSNKMQASEDEKLFQTAQPGINKSLAVAETVLKLIESNGKESELLKKAELECQLIMKLTNKMLFYLSYKINNDTEKWMMKKQSFFKKMGQLVMQNISLLKYLKELIPEFPEIMSLRAEITALSKISKSLIALSESPTVSSNIANTSSTSNVPASGSTQTGISSN